MAVQIITDSTFDMVTRFRDRVSVIPLRISFCERDYIDGVTLTRIKKQNKTGRGAFCLQAQAKGSSSFLLLTILPLTFLLLTILLLITLPLIPFAIHFFTINPYFQFVNLIDEKINQIYNDYKPFPENIGVFSPLSGVNYSVIREINFRVRKDFDSGSGRYFDGIFHDQFCF